MRTITDLMSEREVMVVIADEHGVIVHAHVPEGDPSGWRAGDLVGQLITVIIPRRLHDAHHLGFSRFLLTGSPTLLNQPLRLKLLSKSGEELDSEHVILAEQQTGRWVFGAMIRPRVDGS